MASCFALSVSGACTIRRIAFYSFDYIILINVKVNLLTFSCFSFRMCNCPRCMHIHAIVHELIHQSLCTGLCVLVFFLCCVYFQFRSNWHRLGHRQKIAASWTRFTLAACVDSEMREEENPTPRNSCLWHWASNAPTVDAGLNRGQAWNNIAETARWLGPRVQIPGTPSPCHSPHEVITPLGFFANMIP